MTTQSSGGAKATTLEDVARAAGVSRATVSLVLRESPLVAVQTRDRVRRTMERLRYRPNRMAASLRSKRSYLLGLIVPDLTYPHYAQMAAGVEEAVERAGYSLLIANSHDDLRRERRHLEYLSHYRADGAIVTPVHLQADGVAHLRSQVEAHYPLVCLYREVPGLEADFCGSDVYGATRQLVAHLALDLGHREIALVSTHLENSTNPARVAGWRDQLGELGSRADEELLVVVPRGRDLRAHGEAAVRMLLARQPRPTAIVCVNDLLALGVLRELHRAGVRVPEDMSVAGMSGFSDMSPPERALTTVAEDYRRLGREAGQLILRRVGADAAEGPPVVERRVLSAELLRGETTGPAPSSAARQRHAPGRAHE